MASEAWIIRRLGTLEYPRVGYLTPQSLYNPEELARLVSWLEDRKVRGCTIEDRAPLRTAGPYWPAAFLSYLSKVECPYDFGGAGEDPARSLRGGLSWLVSKALSCEFEDRGGEYHTAAQELTAQASGGSIGNGNGNESCPTNVDTTGDACQWSPRFLAALDAACRSMGIEPGLPLPPSSSPFPPAPHATVPTNTNWVNDEAVVRALEALLPAVHSRVSARSGAAVHGVPGNMNVSTPVKHAPMIPGSSTDNSRQGQDCLAAFAPGVCTGDDAVDRVATVLRMLFLLDLRGLQDEVNELLALTQTINAS